MTAMTANMNFSGLLINTYGVSLKNFVFQTRILCFSDSCPKSTKYRRIAKGTVIFTLKKFVINKNDGGQRVDKFLSKAVPNMPQSYMYRQIRKKRIKLNGGRCAISDRLSENDILELYINDEFFDVSSDDAFDFLFASAKLDIVFEDENILLADKKPGLLSHGACGSDTDKTQSSDTLINRIKRYLYEKGEYHPDTENSFAPALCNRIDRNTGGIVIAAKNAESLRILNDKIKLREVEKRYLCVTAGIPPKKSDIITAYIEKDRSKNTVTISDKKTPRNKTAVTEYSVLRDNGRLALVEVNLLTGRTHQIRAHMAHIGCPLLGDGKYGDSRINREHKMKSQALYSYKLKFDFKTSGGILEYLKGREFTAEKIWFSDMIKFE